MKRRRWAAVLLLGLLGLVGLPGLTRPALAAPDPNNSATWIYSFGAGPIEDILMQAESAKATYGVSISREELAAIILAPTWPETQGGTSKTPSTIVRGDQGTLPPSPMTMGRSDIPKVRSTNVYLFSNDSIYTQYRRAFWHSGIGAWQLDGAGLGRSLLADERISTWTGGGKAANEVARRYKYAEDRPTTYPDKASRRQYAWGPWYGCRTDNGYNVKCRDIFNLIYHAATNRLMVVGDASVGRLGGAVMTNCAVPWQTIPVYCTYVDVAQAQGARDGQFWFSYPDGRWDTAGNPTKSPLATPFYVVSDGTYEYRQWSDQVPKDASYPTVDLYGRRIYQGTSAQDDRVSGKWTQSAVITPY